MKAILRATLALLISTTCFSQTIDQNFGTNGLVVNDLTQAVDALNTMVLQPDGKIVALGFASNSLVLLRYEADGSLDAGFGDDGVVACGYSYSGYIAPLEVALQPADGKIVTLAKDGPVMLLTRYNSDGTVDTGFGNDGIVSISAVIGTANAPICTSMEVLADGSFVVAGNLQSIQQVFLIKYDTDGELDTAFGTDGYTLTQSPEGYTTLYAQDMCMQPDNSFLVAAGSYSMEGTSSFTLIKYTPEGLLDTDFGTGGFVLTDIGGTATNDDPTTLKLQGDGKILVAGTSGSKFAIVRYNTDGTADTGFNGTGIVTTTVGGPYRSCADMLIEPSGKIVIAGYIGDDFACIRYTADGIADSVFGTNGIYKIDFDDSYDYGNVIVRQPDGKYIMGGWTSLYCSDRGFAMTRFSSPTDENLGLRDHAAAISCYPNPTTGVFTIALPAIAPEVKVTTTNSLGQIIHNEIFIGADMIRLSLTGPAGIYFVHITGSGMPPRCLKIVKE